MMRCGPLRHGGTAPRVQRRTADGGYTMVEMVITVAIILIMSAFAVPMVQSASAYFKLRGAVAAVTGAIQSTRYQAISQGCRYQLVIDGATKNYQVQNQCPAGGPFVNVCIPAAPTCPKPITGAGPKVTLNQTTTLTFFPGGRVQSPDNAAMQIIVTYGGKPPETITVSSYGNINVTP